HADDDTVREWCSCDITVDVVLVGELCTDMSPLSDAC
ncbi:MAG: hypothetical protein QOI03_2123, partial [Solirubrobacteraceae bacterium]|nr:hypothetical protein [Solirubrobacteraceae bacterium]